LSAEAGKIRTKCDDHHRVGIHAGGMIRTTLKTSCPKML